MSVTHGGFSDVLQEPSKMMARLRSEEASQMTSQAVASYLNTSIHTGLSNTEAQHRQRIHGHNEFEISEEEPFWKKYLDQVSLSWGHKDQNNDKM